MRALHLISFTLHLVPKEGGLSPLWWRECVWPAAFSLFFFFCKQHHAFHLDLDRPLFLWIIRFPWYSSLKIEIVRLERGFLGWEVRVLWTLIRKVSLTYGKAKKGKYVCMSKNNVKNTKYRRWIEKISLEEII